MIPALLGALLVVLLAVPAVAQERPRSGGELVFVVSAEPASYDGHREGTFALVHPVAPHYSTPLRFDPTDRTGTRVVGDLAESWSTSHSAKVKGWTVTPSHYLNHQLDTVWLAE